LQHEEHQLQDYCNAFFVVEDHQAKFEIKADKIEAREYCNVHGLWRS